MTNNSNQQETFGEKVKKYAFWFMAGTVVVAVGIAWGIFKEIRLVPLQEEVERLKSASTSSANSGADNSLMKWDADPLKVSGKWNYEVYAEQGKFVRARNPITNILEEKYLRIGGDITIDTILKETGRYKIVGKRTSLIDKKGMNVMPADKVVTLDFPEVDFDRYSNHKFSFKFEVTVGDDFGFVRLTDISSKKMNGILYYLYADKQWRKANIRFLRPE